MNTSPLRHPIGPERPRHLIDGISEAGSSVELHRVSTPERIGDGRVVRQCSCGLIFEVGANPTRGGEACLWLPLVCPVEDALTEERAARLRLDAGFIARYSTLQRQSDLLGVALRAGA